MPMMTIHGYGDSDGNRLSSVGDGKSSGSSGGGGSSGDNSGKPCGCSGNSETKTENSKK